MTKLIKIKHFIILFFFQTNFLIYSQTVLEYNTHSIQANYTHNTQMIEYIKPGNSGKNIIWDFSNLKCKKNKISKITEPVFTQSGYKLPNSNIAIIDGVNNFFFNVSKNQNEYIGLITPQSVIEFDIPIVKMVYPFRYGNKFEGNISGEGLYNNKVYSDINGFYTVEADAYGTILLPGNISLENALRVKSTNYIVESTCSSTKFENIKYLWYVQNERYPIMVVMDNKKTLPNGKTIISKKAYYNENAVNRISRARYTSISKHSDNTIMYQVFPNPYDNIINIRYNLKQECKVSIDIYNISGVKIKNIISNKLQQGLQNHIINAKQVGLTSGVYYIKFIFDKHTYMTKIIHIN